MKKMKSPKTFVSLEGKRWLFSVCPESVDMKRKWPTRDSSSLEMCGMLQHRRGCLSLFKKIGVCGVALAELAPPLFLLDLDYRKQSLLTRMTPGEPYVTWWPHPQIYLRIGR